MGVESVVGRPIWTNKSLSCPLCSHLVRGTMVYFYGSHDLVSHRCMSRCMVKPQLMKSCWYTVWFALWAYLRYASLVKPIAILLQMASCMNNRTIELCTNKVKCFVLLFFLALQMKNPFQLPLYDNELNNQSTITILGYRVEPSTSHCSTNVITTIGPNVSYCTPQTSLYI